MGSSVLSIGKKLNFALALAAKNDAFALCQCLAGMECYILIWCTMFKWGSVGTEMVLHQVICQKN